MPQILGPTYGRLVSTPLGDLRSGPLARSPLGKWIRPLEIPSIVKSWVRLWFRQRPLYFRRLQQKHC